jgi:hypothetical protein
MNAAQQTLIMLIRENALETTAHNASHVLALYRALADFVASIVTVSEETKEEIKVVEGWLFPAMKQGMNRPDMTDEECMRLALGVVEEQADNVVKFERGGLN